MPSRSILIRGLIFVWLFSSPYDSASHQYSLTSIHILFTRTVVNVRYWFDCVRVFHAQFFYCRRFYSSVGRCWRLTVRLCLSLEHIPIGIFKLWRHHSIHRQKSTRTAECVCLCVRCVLCGWMFVGLSLGSVPVSSYLPPSSPPPSTPSRLVDPSA